MKIRKRNVNEYDENQNEVTQLLRSMQAAFPMVTVKVSLILPKYAPSLWSHQLLCFPQKMINDRNFWNPVPGLKFTGSTCSTVTLLWCNYWYICQIQLSIWETSYIQHRSHCKWTIGSLDMAIFVGSMLTKSTLAKWKISVRNSKR